MKTQIQALAIVLMLMPQTTVHASDIAQWCENNAHSLEQALREGALSETDLEERDILVAAADAALKISQHRFEKYFRFTLQTTLTDYATIYPSDVARQVLFLRYGVREAIHDLRFLANHHTYLNSGTYSRELLERARSLGARTPLNAEEIQILTTSIQRAIFWLETSDFARLPNYACAYKTLNDTLARSSVPGLSQKQVIRTLRSGVDRSLWLLRGGC